MSSLRQVICALALAAVLAAIPAIAPAYGHALPAQYSIAPNTVIHDKSQVPEKLTISFSERPDPKVSHIQVLDSKNERVDNDDFAITGASGREATTTLNVARMDDGIYSVSWLTMSLDDGHIAQGGYVFGVGNVAVSGTGPPQTTTYVTSFADALLKWPLLVAQAAIVGMIMTHVILGEGKSRRLGSLLVGCSAAIAASSTCLLLLQAANLAGQGQNSSTFLSLATTSPAGFVWLLRLATAAVAASLSAGYIVKGNRLILIGALAAGAASLFSNSMLSHNSAAPFLPALAVAADWVHFMAVSAWVGGLFYLAAIFVPSLIKTADAARILASNLPRFSLIATLSLGIIGVTGIYMAWLHLHTLNSLFATEYGISLAAKLGSALPMVLLGAYHQIRLHRGITAMARSGQGTAVTTFGKTVKAEAIIGIGVLLAASVLTITSPPEQMQHGYEDMTTVEGVDIMIEISPFQPGFNTFTVMFIQGSTPPTNIHHVMMRFTNEDAGIGPIVATLEDAGNGVYSTAGGYLSQIGKWKIDLIAQRMDAYDLNYSFSKTLGSGKMEPAPAIDSFAYLAIGLAAVVVGGSAFYAVQSRKQMNQTAASLGRQ